MLAGKRILVVEDEPIVAMHLEDMLEDLGCDVAGSYSRLPDAVAAAGSGEFDLAVLDVNLGGVESFPVAEVLAQRGVPFVFATGYGGRETPFPQAGTITKPYSQQDLQAALVKASGPINAGLRVPQGGQS